MVVTKGEDRMFRLASLDYCEYINRRPFPKMRRLFLLL
jgi:hypothetical protein